jgi:hypothetical protein
MLRDSAFERREGRNIRAELRRAEAWSNSAEMATGSDRLKTNWQSDLADVGGFGGFNCVGAGSSPYPCFCRFAWNDEAIRG